MTAGVGPTQFFLASAGNLACEAGVIEIAYGRGPRGKETAPSSETVYSPPSASIVRIGLWTAPLDDRQADFRLRSEGECHPREAGEAAPARKTSALMTDVA